MDTKSSPKQQGFWKRLETLSSDFNAWPDWVKGSPVNQPTSSTKSRSEPDPRSNHTMKDPTSNSGR